MDSYKTKKEIATPSYTPQLEHFKQVVEQRRSVRIFKDTKIPSEVMDECLRLAMLAPNSSNLQPWEFYVISSESAKKKAHPLCMNQNAAKTADKLVVVVARTDTWAESAKNIINSYPKDAVPKTVKDYYGKIVPAGFIRGPANLISIPKRGAVFAHRKFKAPIATPIYNFNQLKNWATNNTHLAAQNFMLAMRAHGFDTCAMGGFDEPAMKDFLNLSNDHHIVMVIGCGERTDEGIYGEQFRFDYKDKIFEI